LAFLSPADRTIPIAWDSRDDSGTDLSIRVGNDVGPSAFIIRTLERTGQRMDDAGNVVGTVDDPRTMAELAVKESLLALVDDAFPREMLFAKEQEIAEQARQVDWSKWTFTRILVDEVGFALRVRRDHVPGFVAIADLGAATVIMRGKEFQPT
jgi:hypothetical protein